MRIARKEGCAGLLSDGIRERHKKSVPLRRVENARADIRAALNRDATYRTRKRLMAFDSLLDGSTRSEAAAEAGASASTVGIWVTKLRRGQGRVLARTHKDATEPARLAVSGDALRALAATQVDWRFVKRLRAVASVADGLSIHQAAIRARVHERSLQDWLRRYHAQGVDGLRMPITHARPLMLKAEQVEALRRIIEDDPEATYEKLRGIVAERFGVTYTRPGIKRLVTRSMGFRREGKKLIRHG